MDFDEAAKRLQQDQKSALARSRASRQARSAGAKARREAQLARSKAEKRLREKKLEGERNAKIADRVVRSVGRAERELGVANVGAKGQSAGVEGENKQQQMSLFAGTHPLASGWTFTATSIHGEGDKIALPPSVLETMTSSANDLDPWGSGRNGRPVAFRVGILNPDYSFPAGDKMRALVESVRDEIVTAEKRELTQQSSTMTEDSTNGAVANDDDGSDDESDSSYVEAYLDELSHRYLAYTHGTVVEFTQEEGCVGLPEPIARALLQPNSHSLGGRKAEILVKRTVDPAVSAAKDASNDESGEMDGEREVAMDVDDSTNNIAGEDAGGEKTPGHPAYGLFDVPALPIEITPINSLPPGKNCTFTPTATSIKNGFYTLKDVKLVLEQSLMRTRATLSKGDVIHTWRRGVSFDLIVSSLTPAKYGAVSCVNTDLNVDIGPPEGEEGEPALEGAGLGDKAKPVSDKLGGGRLLSEPSHAEPKQSTPPAAAATTSAIDLPPEPPEDAKEGVCTVQIRGRTPSGTSAAGRRRFDVTTSTVTDLFAFASHVCEGTDPAAFRLVTRFPRRVFRVSSNGGREDGSFDPEATLESIGVGPGQEMFMVEML